MKITIVGGGNIGTQFAVHCAEKGHDVIVYTSKPELYSGYLYIVDESGKKTHEGYIRLATSDPSIAFKGADLILVTMPATMMKKVADLVFANADEKTMIGVVPGNGGSECAFKKCIDRGNVFFGIERVPAVARLVEKGRIVKSTGYRNELHVASLPKSEVQNCARMVENLFDIKTKGIPDYLDLTMTPSNPILHTTRLRTLFRDWHEGVFYDRVPLFYEEWDNASSELLFACDDEVQTICKALPRFDLRFVKSLKDHYESPTIDSMTRKISSIPAFKGLTTPSIATDDGWIPDLHSRYFTADFSFGLTLIQQIAVIAGVKIPNIDATMNWYRRIAIEKEEFCFKDYGITDIKTLEQFYLI